ncbi:hypothetical protein [Stenotrophomonas sp.]|uniref:hypothetical protein n=1 Tax=Stenotrophomonas sp. TaxID=69392 RepID=UPI002898B7CE|nr:hypothetical protein [Stenotrophomonas sp.]
MTTTIAYIITILAFALVACALRGLWANNRTLDGRMEIIRALGKAGWPVDEARAYERVQYGDHYREIFCGRDPLSLYSPTLVAILRAYRSGEASA